MEQNQNYTTVVVFADVSGSSKLYKEVGDDEANRQISGIVDQLMNATREYGGTVIKTIGDEVMSHFTNPYAACEASIEYQRIGENSLPIRVGMAWGSVIEKDNDLFGQAVNDAAAVAKIARGRQIITTQGHFDKLSTDQAEKLTAFDDVKLKGGNTTTKLYRVDWESLNNTATVDHTMIMANYSATHNQLKLNFTCPDELAPITLTEENTPIHMGRDRDSCPIVMPTPLASRDHAHIAFQYGKFVLVDHSTNGTWVRSQGQQVYLRREELPLIGSGDICLGEEVADGNTFIIHYTS
jgi:class 3 adenylate cyclase